MKTKIFCDIADLKLIKKFEKKKNCSGIYHKSFTNAKSWSKKLPAIF